MSDGLVRRSLEIVNENILKMFTVRGYEVDMETSHDHLITQHHASTNYNYLFIHKERSIATFVYTYKIEVIGIAKLLKKDFLAHIAKYTSDVSAYKADSSNEDITNFTMMIVVGRTDKGSINRTNKLAMTLAEINNIVIEIFRRKFFALHQLDHVLVPHHIIHRDVQDVPAFLRMFNIEGRKPPLIYTRDAISRLFCANVGDYFEIHRPDDTTGIGLMIREVIIDPRTMK